MHTCNRRQRRMDKKKLYKQLTNYFLVTLGTLLLAFGAVIFWEKSNLVAGGVSGIAIIIDYFVPYEIYDYSVAGLMVIFWILGLVFVGKDFAIKTLYSSIIYVGFTFLFSRVAVFNRMAEVFAGIDNAADPSSTAIPIGNLILCGIFGGVFVGGGVAITFLGGGSTGGVDSLQIIISKHSRIKESLSSFIIDTTIIVVGAICMVWTNHKLLVNSLCGILSCVVSAMLIEVVYIRNQTSYQVDIISDHWKQINEYCQKELDRGTTIIRAEGGYKGDERIILRVVFDKTQYDKIKNYIGQVDPRAFVTFTQTNAVYGEGFKTNKKAPKNKKKEK